MTIQNGRAFVRLQSQIAGSHRAYSTSATSRRVPISPSIISPLHDTDTLSKITKRVSIFYRSYADRPVSRPKAHTGRETASSRKSPTTSATKAAKKPATTTKAPKSIPGDGSEPTPKIKTKTKAKRKPATKAKSKPKPKKKPKKKAKIVKPKKKTLTDKQKTAKAANAEKAKIKSLKEAALIKGVPKELPKTAWTVFNTERTLGLADKKVNITSMTKETSAQYKALTPEQLEHYNHIANQNKVANQAAYTAWIESMTPNQIRAANLARLQLNKKLSERNSKKKYKQLRDERRVRGRRSAWVDFYRSRFLTGDYNNMKVSVAIALAAREWKGLSEAEKKPFQDAAAEDAIREREERKITYNDEQT